MVLSAISALLREYLSLFASGSRLYRAESKNALEPLSGLNFENLQPKSLMVTASMMELAAGETGNAASRRSHPFMTFPANRASEAVTAFHGATLKWQLVGACFSFYAKIPACLFPFASMGLWTG